MRTFSIVGLVLFLSACGPLAVKPDGGAECSGGPSSDPMSCVVATGEGGGGASAQAGGAAGGASGGGAPGGSTEGPEQVTVVGTMEQGQYATTHGGGEVWRYGARSGPFIVDLESYSEFGAPTMPGTYTLRTDDSNYASCAFCLVLRRGTERYMPVFAPGKTVAFTSLGKRAGERFSGMLNDRLEFRQVTINAQTFATADVPNGKRLSVAGFAWNVVLVPPECGGHGHLHGSTCHCDPGYRVDPANPRNCVPN
jgi:hypothetical protein